MNFNENLNNELTIPISYEKEFNKFYSSMEEKYGDKILSLEGISKQQFDRRKFSENYFNSSIVAEQSVDPNSNIDEISVITYDVESGKAIDKLHSYYTIWKELKNTYNLQEANKICEAAISGDIYIHDLHGVGAGKPYCVGEGTLVSTTNGLIPIEKLSVGDKVLTRQGINTVSQLHTKEAVLFNLSCQYGYEINATDDHKFLTTTNKWKKLKNIKKDDKIVLSVEEIHSQQYQNITENIVFDENYGFLFGLLYSNTTTQFIDGIRIKFNSTDHKLINKTELIIKDICNNINISEDSITRYPEIGNVNGQVEIRITDPNFKSHLESFGFDISGINYKLPDIILRSPKKVKIEFIQALYTLNKNISLDGLKEISFEFECRKFTKSLQVMLLTFGLLSSTNTVHSKYGKICTSLKLIGDSRKDFITKIGFFENDVEEVFKSKNYKSSRVEEKSQKEVILKVQNKYTLNTQKVYDIGVENSHDFIADGFVVHNCFNYSTYDILLNGLPMVTKIKSVAPKHLYSFKSQVEQFITISSNSTLGATGIADLLISMSYYANKVVNTLSDDHFNFATEEDAWNYIRANITSMIYTLNQPMRAHQCFDEKTELLTSEGWKTYSELKLGDIVFSWDEGKLNLQPIEHLHIADYKGKMCNFITDQGNFVVTHNHRVLYKNSPNDLKYKIDNAQSLLNKNTSNIYIPTSFIENDIEPLDISDTLLKLYAVTKFYGFVEDGKVYFSKYLQPLEVKSIIDLLPEIDFESFEETLCIKEDYILPQNINSKLYALISEDENKSFLSKLSKKQSDLILDSIIKLNKNNNLVIVSWKDTANIIQQLCIQSGRSCVSKSLSGFIYEIGQKKDIKVEQIEEVNYTGKIWCPTVADGIIVVRRENMIFVSGNSPFTNISLYDKYFLESLCKDILLPDGTTPNIEIVQKLQELFIDIMNDELKRTPITFPVTTACFLVENKGEEPKDQEFVKMIAEKNLPFGFINMYSGNSSTLSSCCRLRSSTKSEFFNSFGAGSSKIGSLGVVTTNYPRIALRSNTIEEFEEEVTKYLWYAAKINNAKRNIVKTRIAQGAHPLYSLEFMELTKQYSTCGINGFYEALQFQGKDIKTPEGLDYAVDLLKKINIEIDKMGTEFNAPHNVEQIPGENTSIKFCKKDKILGYNSGLTLYSNQFLPLTENVNLLDRILVQGKLDSYFSGGSVLHLNIEEGFEDAQTMIDLINFCVKSGVIYFAFNPILNKCENDHMSVGKSDICPVCGAKIVENFTRVVGFLTSVKAWIPERQEHDFPNRVFYSTNSMSKLLD